MKKYIELNNKNEIIDVFFDYQSSKIASTTKIFLEDTDIKKHKINGKSISNTDGVFLFKYIDNSIIEKTMEEIDADQKTIEEVRNKALI